MPGTRPIENTSRRARSDPYPGLITRPNRGTPIGPNHTVPYGTVFVFAPYQAINCLATFIRSLRDKGRSATVQQSLARIAHHIQSAGTECIGQVLGGEPRFLKEILPLVPI
jgi:hypothetical protein